MHSRNVDPAERSQIKGKVALTLAKHKIAKLRNTVAPATRWSSRTIAKATPDTTMVIDASALKRPQWKGKEVAPDIVVTRSQSSQSQRTLSERLQVIDLATKHVAKRKSLSSGTVQPNVDAESGWDWPKFWDFMDDTWAKNRIACQSTILPTTSAKEYETDTSHNPLSKSKRSRGSIEIVCNL
jgi:hypothetical protein